MLPGIPPAESEDRGFADIIAGLDLPRVPQQERSRQKRDALLSEAARLFEERGYEATTADDIAAAAGVSIGTFYSYFRNKHQVFLTLAARCLESLHELRIADFEAGNDPRQTIRQLVEQSMLRDPLFYGMRRAWSELVPRDPDIAAYDRQVLEFIYRQMRMAARRMAAQGLTWPDLDIDATCWALTLMLDRAWQLEPRVGPDTAEQIRRQHTALADLIYRALFRS